MKKAGIFLAVFARISLFLKNFGKIVILSVAIIVSLSLSISVANAALSDYIQISSSSNGNNSLPVPDKLGLPFENSSEATMPIVKVIKEAIKYVGLLAILALSWGGIQFLTSIGNDEKAKHAKHTVIYALVGVLLSVVAYTIVDIVNSLKL